VPNRRLATAVAAVLTAVALGLCWPSPAAAHRDIVLTVHTDGRGSVWVTAAWSDGHPVTEPIGAMLVATSSTGDRLGPVKLRNIDRSTGTLIYENTLSAGDWTVVAETGQPAIARCEATVRSADDKTPPRPQEVRCAPAASPGTDTSRAPSPTIMLAVVVGVIVAASLVYVLTRSRRPLARRRRP
jgi:hypothetical protein